MKQEKLSKKQKIIQQAINIARRDGLREVTAVRIAKELEMVPSGVYYYFESNQDLRNEAIQEALETAILQHQSLMEESQSNHSSGVDKLFTYITSTLRWAQKFPYQVNFLLEEFIISSAEDRGTYVARSTIGLGLDRILTYLDLAKEQNEISLGKDEYRDAANFIHLALVGLCIRAGLERYSTITIDEKIKSFLKQVKVSLRIAEN